MKRTLVLILLPFIVFAFVSYVVSLKACNYAMSNHPEKLLPFNHKSHVTKYGASDCETCHGYYDNGRFKGIPNIGVCKGCHDGTTAAEIAMLKGYKDSDVPWGSYAKQPDLVYFSHIAVTKNKIPARCSSCHGDKKNSMTTKKTNRIMGKMPMGQCMDCHTALRISNKCLVCHD